MDDKSKINVSKLPKEMDHPCDDGKKLKLFGIADFHSPVKRTVRKSNENIDPNMFGGHYTGWVLRGDKWQEYDDLKKKIEPPKNSPKLIPHLLFYANV